MTVLSNNNHDEAVTHAESIFPGGCGCHDDSGDCDWCQAYYEVFWQMVDGKKVGP